MFWKKKPSFIPAPFTLPLPHSSSSRLPGLLFILASERSVGEYCFQLNWPYVQIYHQREDASGFALRNSGSSNSWELAEVSVHEGELRGDPCLWWKVLCVPKPSDCLGPVCFSAIGIDPNLGSSQWLTLIQWSTLPNIINKYIFMLNILELVTVMGRSSVQPINIWTIYNLRYVRRIHWMF